MLPRLRTLVSGDGPDQPLNLDARQSWCRAVCSARTTLLGRAARTRLAGCDRVPNRQTRPPQGGPH